MNKLKKETNEFLKKYVFDITEYKYIDSSNVENISNFIISEYINRLISERDVAHQNIDEDLLKKADNALFDINSNF